MELLQSAVAQGEAEPFMLALLTDRLLMQEGKPQIYGSQYVGTEEGGVEPWPRIRLASTHNTTTS